MFSGKRDKKQTSPSPPPVPPIQSTVNVAPSEQTTSSEDSALTKETWILLPSPTPSSSTHPALRGASEAADTPSTESRVESPTKAVKTFSEELYKRAQAEPELARKTRLLSFAQVLNESMISAREAKISAETAKHAARTAQLSYEMTAKSVDMLQRLTASLLGLRNGGSD
jgi:hypothetical protein